MPHSFIPAAFVASACGIALLVKSKQRVDRGLKNPLPEEETKVDDSLESEEKSRLKSGIVAQIRDYQGFNFDLDKFPYYLSERCRELLVNTVWVQLKKPEFTKFTNYFPCQSKSVLLVGPCGSELYQELLAKALAKSLQARLLFFDSQNLLGEDEVDKVTKKRIVNCLEEPTSKSSQDVTDSTSSYNKLAANMITLATFIAAAVVATSMSPAVDSSSSSSNNTNKTGSSSSAGPGGANSTSSNKQEEQKVVQGEDATAGEALGTDAIGHNLRVGDRVTYLSADGLSDSRPPRGATGQVICKYETVGVRFDQPVPGGNSLEGRCDSGYGHVCFAHDLQVDVLSREKETNKTVAALFEVLREEKQKGPLIVFLRGAQQLEGCSATTEIAEELEKLDGPVIILGSQVQTREQKEKVQSSQLDSVFDDADGDGGLEDLFFQQIKLQPPVDPVLLEAWERNMEQDAELYQEQENRNLLQGVMAESSVSCPDIDSLPVPGPLLREMDAEDVVGWATSHYLMNTEFPTKQGEKLVITTESLNYGLRMLRALEEDTNTLARVPVEKKEQKRTATLELASKKLKRFTGANKFEERILDVVVPASEVKVSFSEIGALEKVKEALIESVMLPLRRPELFSRGQLTLPCRGILLFGPPGTGKTMLAKAVATEAGANFINIAMSDILSKWLGEAEKSVRAIFTVARKIAPTVIFIDEVDSLLGKRGQWGEHETMRKVKNEFMASWDGLRTKPKERVLVLAATNRPFDLDEAIIRRFPRRLMVDLPDAENRAKILRLILEKEELAEEFDFDELAAMTEGYSGSDLKNLCVAAAHIPIREVLEKEEEQQQELIRREAERKSKDEELARKEAEGKAAALEEQSSGEPIAISNAGADVQVVELEAPSGNPEHASEASHDAESQPEPSRAADGENSASSFAPSSSVAVESLVDRAGEGVSTETGDLPTGKEEDGLGVSIDTGDVSTCKEEDGAGVSAGTGDSSTGKEEDGEGVSTETGDLSTGKEDGSSSCVRSDESAGATVSGDEGHIPFVGGGGGEEGSGILATEIAEEGVAAATVEEVHVDRQEIGGVRHDRGEESLPAVVMRPISMDDMRKARQQVSASTSSSASSMTELAEWNAAYGEGGSRKKEVLTYFL